MKGFALHPITERQINDYIKEPSHAVMLVGPKGIGKSSIALRIAESVLDIPSDGFEDYPYKIRIIPENGKAIGIEPIRQLEHFLSLKVPRQSKFNRAVILESSNGITIEAQNAFLKTLEEPPEGTFIIVNTSHLQELLPTIRSRAQSIAIKHPEQSLLKAHFIEKNHSEEQITMAYAISGGLPGLMQAILEQEDHPLLQATEIARKLISATTYEKLLMVEDLAKQRQLSQDTLFIMQQMARVSLRNTTGQASKKWQAILTNSFNTSDVMSNSAQPKLALTSFALSI